MKERVGVYPGSFDPVHLGHVDLVQRAARLTDRLVVGLLDNPAKSCLFPLDERLEILREVFGGMDGVEVVSFRGLLVDFARQRGADVVFRGLRAVSDFEYEFQMALMNRRLAREIETAFLMASEDFTYLSSRLVKEVAALGGDVTGLVPEAVLQALRRRKDERS